MVTENAEKEQHRYSIVIWKPEPNKKEGKGRKSKTEFLVVNIMKSLCQPASRTIYLPDW